VAGQPSTPYPVPKTQRPLAPAPRSGFHSPNPATPKPPTPTLTPHPPPQKKTKTRYGFNTGSTYLWGSPSPLAVARAAMNTTLSASTAGLAATAIGSWAGGNYDLRLACNGVLSGLVTVTAMCGFVDPYAAAVCGAIAGACYVGFSRLAVRRWGFGMGALGGAWGAF
jgi:hypothetical protein